MKTLKEIARNANGYSDELFAGNYREIDHHEEGNGNDWQEYYLFENENGTQAGFWQNGSSSKVLSEDEIIEDEDFQRLFFS